MSAVNIVTVGFNSDPAVHALQFLDVINMKDPTQKSHFYRNTLREVLPFIPRVSYLRMHNTGNNNRIMKIASKT